MVNAEHELITRSGAEPPVGSRGKAPAQEGGAKPLLLKLKAFCLSEMQGSKLPIFVIT